MYNPHNWVSEEIITADKLNHIETGVQDTGKKAEAASSTGNYLSANSKTIIGEDLNGVLTSMISYCANNANQPEQISTDEAYLFINYANKLQEVGCQIVIGDSGVFKRNGGYDSNGNATWKEWSKVTIEMPVPFTSNDLNSMIIPSINFCVNNKNQPAQISTNELYILINYVNGRGIAQAIISQKKCLLQKWNNYKWNCGIFRMVSTHT